MNNAPFTEDAEAFRDHIATVDERGKRIWVYPKKFSGPLFKARTIVSMVLLAFLFGMPFVKVGGEPLLLFNIVERKFILFSIIFTPQDFHLFALAMITLILFIVLFTVVFGRIFCGWVCPQTIFMEMVFRKIEYWIEGDASRQIRLNKAPWTRDKIIKKVSKHAIFFLLAVLVANTFLAYIIGIEEVFKIASEPLALHLGGFVAMILFSGMFYFVFSFFREQVCTVVCPYGRLQGVLLSKDSIVVAYDFERGEPRGKIQSSKTAPKAAEKTSGVTAPAGTKPLLQMSQTATLGDCIDCGLCVRVCPTGIDIRNGTQMECVNCTACIDACDSIMDKVNRPRGLIRYDSYIGIKEGKRTLFSTRVKAYSVVLSLLIVLQVVLLSSRTDVETSILRTPGMLYQKVDDTYISNLYNYQLINKTNETIENIEFNLVTGGGRIKPVGKVPDAPKQAMSEGAFFVEMEKDKLSGRKNSLIIEVYSNGKRIDRAKTNFLGPVK